MPRLARLTRRVVPADWREPVERDLAEEASKRPVPGGRAELWMTWQFLRIGAGLRWSRVRRSQFDGPHVLREGQHALPIADSGRHVRAALTITHEAWRALRHSPSTTAFAMLVLTVAIAAATVTFSVVDAVVLRSLPFEDSERLVTISSRRGGVASFTHFDAWQQQATSFESLAAGRLGPAAELATGAGQPARTGTWQTTASAFEALRVEPLHGRLFTSENEVVGRDDVALIGYRTWQEVFGGDPDVVGQSIRLVRRRENTPDIVTVGTIVGVMPAGFRYPLDSSVDIWIPHASGSPYTPPRPSDGYLHVIGRLRDGVTLEQARAELETIKEATSALHRLPLRDGWQPVLTPLLDSLVGDRKSWMLLVLCAAALLLLVACVNVANLMLLRSAEHARVLAVRASLGASPTHLAATLLVESVMLSLTAAGLGIILAFWGVAAAKAALPAGVFRADTIAVDLRVLAVAVTTAVAAGIFFGVVPAWNAARSRPVSFLASSTARATPGHRRSRTSFLVGEIVLVGALLVVSTLFVGSFVRVLRLDLGFAREGLVAATLDETRGFTGPSETLLNALRTTSGVVSVAEWTGPPPFLAQGGAFANHSLKASEHASDPGEISVLAYGVSPGFFDTAGIRLLRGRAFTDADTDAPVAIIDELTAGALFFDGRDPLGGVVVFGSTPATPLTVVGVVQTVQRDGPERLAGPQLYRPKPVVALRGSQFLVRTSGSSITAVRAIQRSLQRVLPPGTATPQVRSIEDDFNQLTAGRRANATIMSLFGVIVLLIGGAGVYAVMASTVAQQQRELGVRVALGATRGRIIRGVLSRAVLFLTVGLAMGLAAGRALSTLFAAMLFEVRPSDASTYVIVAALLMSAGLVAALRPALRAARVDPITTLRAD